MSYSRSYSATLEVTLTGSVSYPASQSGGWTNVTLTDYVPINVDIDVETEPFDYSVYRTGMTVDTLTGSVAAMNSAQCLTIRENSRQISNHLTDGFFNMIRSDISMKQSENFSQLQSRMALLMELAKDVNAAHNRMSGDIERLRRHYMGIFQGLNEDLEKRIEELDKPAFQIGEKTKKELIVDPVTKAGAATADAMADTSQMAGRISMARMKKRISSAISGITESVKKSMSYKTSIEGILSTSEEGETEYIPVMYARALNDNGRQFSYYVPEMKGSDSIVAGVSSFVSNAGDEQWSRVRTEEQGNLEREFISMVENNSRAAAEGTEYSNRVYSEILKMWNRNKTAMTQLYRERQEQ